MTTKAPESEETGPSISAPAPKKKKKKSESANEALASPPPGEIERTTAVSRLTQHGWIAGVAGIFTVLGLGYLGSRLSVLEKGWGLPVDIAPSKSISCAFALLVVAIVMFVVELAVRLRVDKGNVISVADEIREKKYGAFFGRCVKIYLADLFIFALFFGVYRSAGEYGFSRAGGYYQPWFAIMDYVFGIYAIFGLPYIALSRAYQHDPKADRKLPAFTLFKLMDWAGYKLSGRGKDGKEAPVFDEFDRTAVLGLFVKAFFVPLMTVFFADQFGNLVKNYSFVLGLIAQGTRKPTIREGYDCALSVIFAVDVGLAWAGYVLSSRWIKNGMVSVEPTLLGWAVALLCYPPFNRIPGFYFSNPGEHAFLALTSKPAIILLASCSIASFAVYTSATVVFGLHFSNLTHRGIITTGAYSYVRHPAYASKNFSWWCVMFPYAIADAWTKGSFGILAQNFVGLLSLSGLYYFRALTEERHLSKDPEYQDYMKKVPYRFIPGLI